ncbi:hypothetical protein [Acrocarpospora pleiomorpha]|uniref:hypothetical protein n=1 Tax=Acrocarpospora pleiomorpha TaxID=90975 RepID=UPI0031D40E74
MLSKIPTAARDLAWLADRSRGYAKVIAVKALARHSDPAIREWVMGTPKNLLSSDLARQIVETHGLAEMLSRPGVDDTLWDQAGNLLLAMTSTHNYHTEISRYRDALTVYQRWIALAARRPATLERAAMLTMVADDLGTGPAAPVVGGLRETLIEQIKSVLSAKPWTEMLARSARSSDPIVARRSAWVLTEAGRSGVPEGRFAIRVVAADPNPADYPYVEARIVIDGMPVVAALFDIGPAESPGPLLDTGRLRAVDEPKTVRIAEAYCTEGCCSGLYVTIVREGREVVWKDWHSSVPGDPPQEVRFDAAEYDQEVARAEQDHSWEWPDMTVARLVAERLRADATILGRWDCAFGWCTAWLADVDMARLTFDYPAGRLALEDLSVRFGLMIETNGQPPDVQAAEIVKSLAEYDPKATAEMIDGGKNEAGKLGLIYREPSRW